MNPRLSYDSGAIINHAHRIHKLFALIEIDFPASRICIEIHATWEGLAACGILEEHNIKTLATSLFTPEQAIAAAKAGCSYIAPYTNELKVHFEEGSRYCPRL